MVAVRKNGATGPDPFDDTIEEVDLFALGGHALQTRPGRPDASGVLADLDGPGRAQSPPDASGPRLKLPPPSVHPPARESAPATLPPMGPALQGGFPASMTVPPKRRLGLPLVAALFALGLVAGAVLLRAVLGTGTLVLRVEPADAMVVVDGQVQTGQGGVYEVEGLDADRKHVVVVRRAGYRGWASPVGIKAAERTRLPTIRLEPELE